MILEVIVDISNSEVDRTFDYEGDDIPVGSRVVVEFGRKRLIGFVVSKKEKSEFEKLKKAVLLDTPIDSKQLELLNYMRKNYNLKHIDVLRLFVPLKLRDEKDPESTRLFLSLDENIDIISTLHTIPARAKKQLEVVNYLSENGGKFNNFLVSMFGVSSVKALRDKGVLIESSVHDRCIPIKTLSREDKKVTLTSQQEKAVDTIIKKSNTYLLHGVTGSGKTEVYQRIIQLMLEKGKTAIMLVPEIALTPQMLGIFRARFGDNVAILHSGLNASERYDEWKRLRDGKANIAIGARSAIFAPLSNIGVIIIDEEHDASYQSESNPRYDTKVIAEFRAKQYDCSLILGSATPDIETFLKASEDKYTLVNLSKRISKHNMPEIEIVNMVDEFRKGNKSIFSYSLVDNIRLALEKKEQIMIFLNRRGFSSYVRCKECGYIAKCQDCDISLSYHITENRLKCHYCGRRYHALSKCPDCSSTDIKQGKVGTQKVVEELNTIFPDANILRMDNDSTSSKDSYFRILDKFANGKADILVGTQMIAKGHDFSNVTLVGILEADSALYFSDYRSAERTFQIITQVAGRAGRADLQGKVVLQTYAPKHYVFKFAKEYDYLGFWKKENNIRLVTNFPPYTKIIRVLVSGEIEQNVVDIVRPIYKCLVSLQETYGKFVYIGAQKSPVLRVKGSFRYQVLIRISPEVFEKAIENVYKIVDEHRTKKGSCFVEINPQSLI